MMVFDLYLLPTRVICLRKIGTVKYLKRTKPVHQFMCLVYTRYYKIDYQKTHFNKLSKSTGTFLSKILNFEKLTFFFYTIKFVH